MSFNDIKGQDRIVKVLKDAISSQRIHHAYLFVGSQGVGKTLTAKNFALLLNCLDIKDNDSCSNCINCQKIEADQSPDVVFAKGTGEGGTFKIEDMKNLQNIIFLKPFEARKKVFIVEDASRMTLDAANSFLKTLEEPPEDSVIILIAHDKSKIIPTIYSRCEVMNFSNLTRDFVKSILIEKFGIFEFKAGFVANYSKGSLKDLDNLKDIEDLLTKKNAIIDKFKNNIKLYDDFGESKVEAFEIIEVLSFWYRDILMAKIGLDNMLTNSDRIEEILNESNYFSVEDLVKVLEQLDRASNLISLNANTKLSMSVLKMEIEDICMKSSK